MYRHAFGVEDFLRFLISQVLIKTLLDRVSFAQSEFSKRRCPFEGASD